MQIIYSVRNNDGMRAEVRMTSSKVRPYSVVLIDEDSGNTLPTSYHFSAKSIAIEKAHALVNGTGTTFTVAA